MKTTKEKMLDVMSSIQRNNPDDPDESHWRMLQASAEHLTKERQDPQMLIAFFRLGLEASEEMEKKHPGWTQLMKRGMRHMLRIVHEEDQVIAAGASRSDVAEIYKHLRRKGER